MQIRAVRRHQTRLREDQGKPCCQHDAMHDEVGRYRQKLRSEADADTSLRQRIDDSGDRIHERPTGRAGKV